MCSISTWPPVPLQFEHQCRPFFVAGFNVDNVGQAPISALARKMRGSGYNGRRLVRELLRKATDSGLNVMRTFAHTTDPNYPMQASAPCAALCYAVLCNAVLLLGCLSSPCITALLCSRCWPVTVVLTS